MCLKRRFLTFKEAVDITKMYLLSPEKDIANGIERKNNDKENSVIQNADTDVIDAVIAVALRHILFYHYFINMNLDNFAESSR